MTNRICDLCHQTIPHGEEHKAMNSTNMETGVTKEIYMHNICFDYVLENQITKATVDGKVIYDKSKDS